MLFARVEAPLREALRGVAVFQILLALSLARPPAVGADTGVYREITAPVVKTMIESRNAVVVNVLSSMEHEMQHIKGSINIPIIEMETTDRLPENKATPLIFYCMGTR